MNAFRHESIVINVVKDGIKRHFECTALRSLSKLPPTFRSLLLVAALGASASACADKAAAPEESGLGAVNIPAGATLATTKSAALEVTSAKAGSIEVRRLDDKVLYRGAIAEGGALAVKLWLPVKDDDLKILFTAGDDHRESMVHVAEGATSVSFD